MPPRCNWLPVAVFLVLVAGSPPFLAAGLGGRAPDPPPSEPELCCMPPKEPAFKTPEAGTVDGDVRVFNQFSWADFIALNWPALDGKRGIPDTDKNFGDAADRVVWESYKSLDELFVEDPLTYPPTVWDRYEPNLSLWTRDRANKPRHYALKDELKNRSPERVKLLYHAARLGEVNLPSLEAFPRGPLITQRRTYVRFETRVNRKAYEFMTQKDHKYYLRCNLPAEMEFPDGSINVKAAWMELPDDAAVRQRIYCTTAAVVVDWTADGKPIVEERIVGLVGLHIVHKTASRKDWIWSTFEHVDNLLAEHGPGTPPASFSTKDPPATGGQANKPEPDPLKPRTPYPKPPDRTPVEVARIPDTIHAITKDVNQSYQNHSQIKGTKWRYYKLVGTQWPKFGKPTKPPQGNPTNILPPDLANVTMETYFQRISCLNCHAAAAPAGFVFYPGVRAYPPPPPN
jgi:hypothetical protein